MLERPAWRGVLHSWAFFAAIPAGVLLIVFAGGAAGRTAASIYTFTLLLVFGTSASYHRLAQSPRARRVMQRLDHTMIYLLIAGTYAPLCLVALPMRWGIPLLATVTAIGVVRHGHQTLRRPTSAESRICALSDHGLGGGRRGAGTGRLADRIQLALIVGGGIAYTVGFPVLLLKRPDPWPRSFGYHEVWHGFTVLAAILHFGAVASVVA